METKFTKGPWKWGADWTDEAFGDPDDEYSGAKYADLRLIGADGSAVIPLQIDHHDVMVDHDGTKEFIKSADRMLICAAPDLFAALEAQRDAEEEQNKCSDCDAGGLCEKCSGNFQVAEQLRRAALAKAVTP